jgi:hypothetical protein
MSKKNDIDTVVISGQSNARIWHVYIDNNLRLVEAYDDMSYKKLKK